MFGHSETKVRPPRVGKTDPTSRNGHEPGAAVPSTRLTIGGQHSRVEGKFEIADSIQIVHLVEDKRVGAQK